MGFAGGSFPFPMANRVRRRLRQDGVSTFDVNRLHASVGSNQRVYLDDALQRHAPGERRLFRRSPQHQLASGQSLLSL